MVYDYDEWEWRENIIHKKDHCFAVFYSILFVTLSFPHVREFLHNSFRVKREWYRSAQFIAIIRLRPKRNIIYGSSSRRSGTPTPIILILSISHIIYIIHTGNGVVLGFEVMFVAIFSIVITTLFISLHCCGRVFSFWRLIIN